MKNPINFTPKEQMQISLIALGGMSIMLLAFAVFSIVWVVPSFNLSSTNTLIFKIMIGINAMFGVMFLGSSFVGLYQQYKLIGAVEDLGQGNLPDLFLNNLKGGKNAKIKEQ